LSTATLVAIGLLIFIPVLWVWLTIRYIQNDYVGIVEKLWSSGSVGEGRIIALKINEFCAKESCCVRSRDRTNRKPVAARELNASYAANNKLQKAVESEVTSSPR
jgi:hypothetical protein